MPEPGEVLGAAAVLGAQLGAVPPGAEVLGQRCPFARVLP